MIDLANGSVHWFDFETIHDPARPITWQRADDVRALLTTCLARAAPEKRAEIIRVVLDLYGDERVARVLSERFTSMLQRPLTFHLAQAPLSCESFRQIARLLNAGGAP